MGILGSIIGAAGSLLGGSSTKKAAKKAAQAEVDAANIAAQSQERMLERQIGLSEPFRQGGITAENRLLTLLGLQPAGSQPSAPAQQPGGQTFTVNGQTYTIPGWGGNYTTAVPATGAQPANTMSGLSVDSNDPDFGKYARDFGMQDFEADPGYAFRLSEGMKALNNSMAARGLGISGSNIKGALRYGQDMGSQEYQNAFNRYQVNRNNQLNPLQSLTGMAQTSTNALLPQMGQAATNIGNAAIGAGNARASAYGVSGAANANMFNNIGYALGNALDDFGGNSFSRLVPSVSDTISSNRSIF